MNKLMIIAGTAIVAATLSGCKSTLDDRWRSDMRTTLQDAHFTPIYEVQKDKGIVKGEAEATYSFWGLFGSAPDTFANEIGGPICLMPGCKEAAFADACKKANCQILLAPRFTVTKERGFLWFSGRDAVTVEGIPAVLKTAEAIPVEKWVEYNSKLPPAPAAPALPTKGFLPF